MAVTYSDIIPEDEAICTLYPIIGFTASAPLGIWLTKTAVSISTIDETRVLMTAGVANPDEATCVVTSLGINRNYQFALLRPLSNIRRYTIDFFAGENAP